MQTVSCIPEEVLTLMILNPNQGVIERLGWRVKARCSSEAEMVSGSRLAYSTAKRTGDNYVDSHLWIKADNAVDAPRHSNGVEVERYFRSPQFESPR